MAQYVHSSRNKPKEHRTNRFLHAIGAKLTVQTCTYRNGRDPANLFSSRNRQRMRIRH